MVLLAGTVQQRRRAQYVQIVQKCHQASAGRTECAEESIATQRQAIMYMFPSMRGRKDSGEFSFLLYEYARQRCETLHFQSCRRKVVALPDGKKKHTHTAAPNWSTRGMNLEYWNCLNLEYWVFDFVAGQRITVVMTLSSDCHDKFKRHPRQLSTVAKLLGSAYHRETRDITTMKQWIFIVETMRRAVQEGGSSRYREDGCPG
mgnify:CR=1 FL=1